MAGRGSEAASAASARRIENWLIGCGDDRTSVLADGLQREVIVFLVRTKSWEAMYVCACKEYRMEIACTEVTLFIYIFLNSMSNKLNYKTQPLTDP